MRRVARVARVLAIAIVVAGVVDPVWTVARPVRPVVTVVETMGATREDVDRVIGALESAAEVSRTWRPESAATVMVGNAVPERVPGGPVIVVPPAAKDRLVIRAIEAPARVPVDGVAQLGVTLALPTDVATDVRVRVLADNVPQVELREPPSALRSPDTSAPGPSDTSAPRNPGTSAPRPSGTSALQHLGTSALRIPVVPSRPGLMRVRVEASLGDGPAAAADVAVEVTDVRWKVLVYDGRPTWASTFVRRALEDDPRFDVVARTATSRGASASSGTAPPRLSDVAALDDVQVVVVGAPDALSGQDVDVLERFVRQRRGAVVVLPEREDGEGLSRLTGVDGWRAERQPEVQVTTGVAGGAVRASEFVWPLVWPRLAEPVAACAEARDCAVWRVARGGGQVIVASAVDAWRLRTADEQAYDRFWRHAVATAAEATPPPVALALASPVVEPGGVVHATVTRQVSTAAGLPAGAPTGEWQDTQGGRGPVTWWPESAGHSVTEFRAPATPGRYRLVATVDGRAARTEFLVVEPGTWVPPMADLRVEREALVTAQGGGVVASDAVATLPEVVGRVVGERSAEMPVAPWRSAWWLWPCVGLLSFEWWMRRREGER